MKNLKFVGSFWEFFGINILLTVGCFLTLGILAPYAAYWNIQFIINNTQLPINQ